MYRVNLYSLDGPYLQDVQFKEFELGNEIISSSPPFFYFLPVEDMSLQREQAIPLGDWSWKRKALPLHEGLMTWKMKKKKKKKTRNISVWKKK